MSKDSILTESKPGETTMRSEGTIRRLDELDELEVRGLVESNEVHPTAGCTCDCDPGDGSKAKASFHFGVNLSK